MFFMDILLAMRITPFMIDFTIIVRGSADKILRNHKEKCPDKTGIRVRCGLWPATAAIPF
jgi:hypothetical protein